MATITHTFGPMSAIPASSNYGTQDCPYGSNFPVPCLDFDAATDETVFFIFQAVGYGSGNISVDVDWYADTGSSGNVVWGAAVAAITQNTDTQDIETKAFATANTVQDAHLGTTNQRLHRATITVSNLDSIAADDWVALKLYRDADSTAATDDMTGDACVVNVAVRYSDT